MNNTRIFYKIVSDSEILVFLSEKDIFLRWNINRDIQSFFSYDYCGDTSGFTPLEVEYVVEDDTCFDWTKYYYSFGTFWLTVTVEHGDPQVCRSCVEDNKDALKELNIQRYKESKKPFDNILIKLYSEWEKNLDNGKINENYEKILKSKITKPFSDEKITLIEYLLLPLKKLWQDKHLFTYHDRLFENEDWDLDIFQSLIRNCHIKGKLDEEGYIDEISNPNQAYNLVEELIDYIITKNL